MQYMIIVLTESFSIILRVGLTNRGRCIKRIFCIGFQIFPLISISLVLFKLLFDCNTNSVHRGFIITLQCFYRNSPWTI